MSIQTPGILTEKRREYLLMSKNERDSTYTPDQRHQMDLAIRRHGEAAIEDLIIMANTISEKDLRRIFKSGKINKIVYGVGARLGSDWTDEVFPI